MEFDDKMTQDSEMRQREACITSLPVPQSQQPPTKRIPPIKPRRSLKSRPTPKEEAGPPRQPANSREGEISPCSENNAGLFHFLSPSPSPQSVGITSAVSSQTVVQKVCPALMRCGPGVLEALSPSLRAHALLWFQRSQLPRLRRPGQPLPCWLHGFATRREAEELLKDEAQGCFLVRLSESKIGFVLSYRGRDRCRHFILEEEGSRATEEERRYLIAGEESRHGSLQELINYYTQHAVGPFEEVLTLPCIKGKRGCGDLVALGLGGMGGGALGTEQEPSVTPAALLTPETAPAPQGATAAPPPETPQYAVVRKMRKAHSLPESQTDEVTEQVPDFIPATPPKTTAPQSEDPGAQPGDPQYARVIKPPRAFASTASPSSSPSSSSSADAQPGPHPGLRPDAQACAAPPRRGLGEEQKYWELEPMHTYEETHHLTHARESDDHIHFYAMGRREDIQRSGETAQNHLYSEVNLRGLREGPPTVPIPPPARTAPGLPLRPPPRLTDCPSHLDPALQRLDGHLPLTPPSHPGLLPQTHSPIYEQIPMGGLSAGPPVPPQNHKH